MATCASVVVKGTVGNDVMNGSEYAQLIGGAGNDIYNLWSPTATVTEFAGEGIDTINARYWGPVLLPPNVENLVMFTMGNTKGTGNALNNTITASPYGSTLNGMGGNDTLIGGAGADVFEFARSSGSDTVVNFQAGWDSIRLMNYGYTSFQQVLAQGTQVGKDVRFALGGTTLTLQGVKLTDLTAGDFGFALTHPIVPQGYLEMDGAGRAYNSNGWYVHNNAWGSNHLIQGKDYTLEAVYSRQDMTSGTTFTWTYPYSTESYPVILAYPEVSFGVSPKAPEGHKSNPTDKAAVFPVGLQDIRSLVLDYDVSFGGTVSGFNVAYDIWLTSVPYGDRSTITHEIMFWVHTGDFPAYGKVVGTYTQDGINATIYRDGTYVAVVTDKDIPKGTLDLAALFDAFKSMGIVQGDEYLASIHLGAEVVSGNGSLTINNLDFTLETYGADGSIVRKEVTGAGTTVTTIPPVPEVPETPVPIEAQPVTDVAKRDEFAGSKVGSQITTIKGVTTDTLFYDAKGKLLGLEQIQAKGGGETITQFFDSTWKLISAEHTNTYSDGRINTRYFDGNWKLTGATDTTTKVNGSVLTQHFDNNWKFTGAAETTTKANGSVLTQHFDNNWRFTGAMETTTKANGSVLTQHFDVNWKLASADEVTFKEGGSTTNHFDGSWKFTGAEILQEGADGVNVTTHYDAKWAVISRTLEGTSGVDSIAAGWGKTTIYGGFGSDLLVGGNGADTFVFDTAIGNGDVDKIGRFQTRIDKFALDQDIFTGLDLGALNSSQFVVGKAAKDADDRIIFDNVSGKVYYDGDGSGTGAAVHFATITGGLMISANDFVIV